MNLYYCSDGSRLSENQIQSRYSVAIREKHEGRSYFVCEACGRQAQHNDHTIAKARCKVLHKTELIFDPDNFVDSCPKCHEEWESYKSGQYLFHRNVVERMQYLFDNDIESFTKRSETDYGNFNATLLTILREIN